MTSSKKLLGKHGEEYVAEFLLRHGSKIIHRNLRTPYGEVDLVSASGSTLSIFEIKTRRLLIRGLPKSGERSFLSWTQRKRLEKAAQWIWIRHRREYRKFQCHLVIVTDCGIKWLNLPLLYDQA